MKSTISSITESESEDNEQNQQRKLNENELRAQLSINNTSKELITCFITFAYSYKTIQLSLISTIIKGNNRLSLNELLTNIPSELLTLDDYSISYSDTSNSSIYFHCGTYPLQNNILCELNQSKTIWIKLRKIANRSFKLRLELEDEEAENNLFDDANDCNYMRKANSHRSNERTIKEVIKKVYMWKKLNEGIVDINKKNVKFNLQEAARELNVNKKSLDEYYYQIKYGKQFGFNFNRNRNEKVGVLRGYVKKCIKLKKNKKDQSNKPMSQETIGFNSTSNQVLETRANQSDISNSNSDNNDFDSEIILSRRGDDDYDYFDE